MEINYRQCVSCRRMTFKKEFWRVVKLSTPKGLIVLDQGIGRSAYLCQTNSCLKDAKQKKRLGRSLKAIVPEELFTELEQRLSHNIQK